jgi:hypothetical protein
MRLFLASIALTIGFVATAWAAGCGTARPAAACAYSWDAAKYDPDQARQFGEGSAVKLCTVDGAMKPTLFATPIARGDKGVCFFWVGAVGAPTLARTLMMQPASGSCPRQDDPGYVENRNVPDGVFAELMSQWKSGALTLPDAFKTRLDRKRVVIREVTSGNWQENSGFENRARAGSFVIVADDPDKRASSYNIEVDWTQGAFRVTGVTMTLSGC